MRIVFIGDIYGRSGREALKQHLPKIKSDLKPDVIIVNGENAAHGRGITVKMCNEIFDLGVDVITTGNHVWDQREIIPHIDKEKRLLRPINFPQGTVGNGSYKHRLSDGRTILVINAMGRIFMDALDNPFQALKTALKEEKLGQTSDAIFIDFHAETTSEKMCAAHYLDGKITALIGTHTHIPTADAHIMENGTAYQTDAGMTGDYNSSIGAEKEGAIQKFVTGIRAHHMKPATGEASLCGTLIVSNGKTGKAESIHPIRMGGVLPEIFPVD